MRIKERILRFLFRILKKVLVKFNHIPCRLMSALDTERKDFVFDGHDYIRKASLELIAKEIYEKNIAGSAAELGVYQGEFAKIINKAFPDRKLYLFDTFEGFDERDIKTEITNNFSTGKEDFTRTSVELVLSEMENRGNCIIKKGFFPETAEGIDEVFAFVSLDADLYEPVYKGLNYFYEKLSPGGYIMLHDYNSSQYIGAKKALRQFSKERNITYVPIPDTLGSAIIMKP